MTSHHVIFEIKETEQKESRKAIRKRYYEKNKERLKAMSALWRKQNPEKAKAISKRYKEKNRDAIRARENQWRKEQKQKKIPLTSL